MNMNHINMNGANGVGGGMPMMQNGTNGASRTGSEQSGEHDYKTRMNTFIYDYFLKQEQYDCAKVLLDSPLNVLTTNKPSPGHRTNGIDEGDHDSKDDIELKRPHGLPYPDIGDSSDDSSFLLEWFSLFWDMFLAAGKKKGASVPAMQYVQHNHHTRMHNMRQAGGPVPGMQNYPSMLRIQQQPGNLGMMNANDLRQRVASNGMRTMTQQQILARNQMLHHQQMERGASDANMSGQRPRTPSAGDNAPSPSKRPRLDPQFPGQPIMQPNGRPFPTAVQMQQLMNMKTGQNNNRLVNNGINPNYLTPEQLETFHAQPPQVQEKSIQMYTQNLLAQQKRQGMPQPGMPGQGSPMMPGSIDVGAGMQDFYGGNGAGIRMNPGGQPNGGANPALQDYQMQLMLLEHQNKKRLLMAKQEQDNLRPDGQPQMAGGPGYPAGMSPQGSRSGPSPNPSDQMKRGTPNLGQVGLPGSGSPRPDGSMAPNRGSPGPMNFGGQLGPEMFHPVAGPNGPIMRAPSSNPQFNGQMGAAHVEAAMRAQQNGGRIPNGVNWPQGHPSQAPMMPQVSQAQPPMGTPQQRTMPPPSGPPASGPANGRPASPPQTTAAPPTPQQANKAAPKDKKNTKETNRKRPTKKASTTAATPSSEAENPPPTPTPSTPITPQHPKNFGDPKPGNAQGSGASAQAPTSVPAPAPVAQPQPEAMPQFSNVIDMDPNLDMTFSMQDTGDVLEGFDFDSFLQDGSDPHLDFDPTSMTFGEFPMETGNVES